jgi:hypothetical protein
MSQSIGWWIRSRVKYREDDLINSRQVMDMADVFDKTGGFLSKGFARVLRRMEKKQFKSKILSALLDRSGSLSCVVHKSFALEADFAAKQRNISGKVGKMDGACMK